MLNKTLKENCNKWTLDIRVFCNLYNRFEHGSTNYIQLTGNEYDETWILKHSGSFISSNTAVEAEKLYFSARMTSISNHLF